MVFAKDAIRKIWAENFERFGKCSGGQTASDCFSGMGENECVERMK